MYQRTLTRAIKEFIEHHTRTRPVSNKKPLRNNKITCEPEFDYEYITNPANRKEIEDNIKRRKNVGDLNRVLELDEQFRAEKCPGKRETLWQSLQAEASILPNRTHPVVREYKERPKVLKSCEHVDHSFPPKTFHELAKDLRLIRTEDLKVLTGSRSYFFIGDLADLEYALVKFAISALLKKNFQLVSVPDIVPIELLQKCGITPNSIETQVYHLEDAHGPNLALSGTSEMPLAGLFVNSVLNKKDLPICVTAVSRCYRSEISNLPEERGIYSYDPEHMLFECTAWQDLRRQFKIDKSFLNICHKDNEALKRFSIFVAKILVYKHKHQPECNRFRVHQFTKVEMFGVTSSEDSEQLMSKFVDIQEEMFRSLGLEYQILDMPMHELGASAYRKHDIEAWYPGKDMYGEISSCSNCSDYQSRRLNIKYRDGDKLVHAHTVNGTACAVPRTIMALFETHQQQNGNIKLPECLRAFLNGKEEIQLQNAMPKMKSKVRERRKTSS